MPHPTQDTGHIKRTPPALTRTSDVAKPTPPRLGPAVLHVGDLVRGNQHPPALGHRQREHRVAALLQRVGQQALYFLARGVRLHGQLPRHRVNPDLDFHETLPSYRGQPLMPRQASRATSCSAASREMRSRVVLSQYLAVTWARPTIATPTRRAKA